MRLGSAASSHHHGHHEQLPRLAALAGRQAGLPCLLPFDPNSTRFASAMPSPFPLSARLYGLVPPRRFIHVRPPSGTCRLVYRYR